jgi:hypothetical protein
MLQPAQGNGICACETFAFKSYSIRLGNDESKAHPQIGMQTRTRIMAFTEF